MKLLQYQIAEAFDAQDDVNSVYLLSEYFNLHAMLGFIQSTLTDQSPPGIYITAEDKYYFYHRPSNEIGSCDAFYFGPKKTFARIVRSALSL